MKRTLELNIPDSRVFLNFWNSFNGDDVICEIINGKLILHENEESKEITLTEFVDLVKSKEYYE